MPLFLLVLLVLLPLPALARQDSRTGGEEASEECVTDTFDSVGQTGDNYVVNASVWLSPS